MKGINNTTTVNFETLIGGRSKFVIPKFQRDYSWDTQQWDDLWQDILIALEDSEDHYMGYLVLQNSGAEKINYIIDGQQRFTTITLIILAAIKSIKRLIDSGVEVENNQARVDNLISTYIGYRNPISLEYDNILHLNRNNNGYYREYIVKMGELRTRGILSTEKLMKRCFEFYDDKLKNRYHSGEEYAKFITSLVNRLHFTVITVSDQMNAFKVFETLNARGVQLSSSDLLKNYLFSLIDQKAEHKGVIADLDDKWIKLTSNVKEQKLPEFIRYYWNSKNKTIRGNELFKEIRKNITQDTQVFEMVNEMISYSDVYMALQNPNDSYWEYDPDLHDGIGLLKIFGLKQAFPLLMAANKLLDKSLFASILKDIITISFRYNVICGKNPNDIERVYNEVANIISQEGRYDRSILQRVYIADSEFNGAFVNKSFVVNARNNKIVKYILGKIELHDGGRTVDIYNDLDTIEHILPQSPDEDIWGFDTDNIEQWIYRLGNMCVLESGLNHNIGNQPYSEKVEVYRRSSFTNTGNIPESYTSWDSHSIHKRQSQMAKVAKGIWKIQF